MFPRFHIKAVVLVTALTVAGGGMCQTIPPNGGGGPGGGVLPFVLVKTGIDVRHDAGLECGDDLIAFGTSATTGVSYIFPSTNPTTGTAVTSAENYDSSAFAVGGRTIFLAGHAGSGIAFQVSVYDTGTGAITQTFAVNQIRLSRIPVTQDETGNMRADGTYCVVICDQATVTDGKIIKVIDTSGGAPTLIAFATNPAATAFQVEQVAVDAATGVVVAVANDTFFVYDIANPNMVPRQIASPNGIGNLQMKIHGSYVIATDNQAFPQAILVNLATDSIIALTDAQAAAALAISEDIFGFFANFDADDSVGGDRRAAIGAIPGPAFTKAALGNRIDGSTTNNGTVGFAGTMAMRPNGDYVFLANAYFQYSLGDASFVVPGDQNGEDPLG